MLCLSYIFVHVISVIMCLLHISKSDQEVQAIENIFSKCKKKSPQFDTCIHGALNQLQPFFKRGIPEMGIAPFDPHFAPVVQQEYEIFGIKYTLILRNVYEKGWTQSTVTKYKQVSIAYVEVLTYTAYKHHWYFFRTDWENATVVYSQYFPEKTIQAQYEFKSGLRPGPARQRRQGRLSMTLRDYAQTTRLARRAAGLRVRVAVGRIGHMDLHLYNLHNTTTILGRWVDGVIKAFWKPGFAVIRPAINDLVHIPWCHVTQSISWGEEHMTPTKEHWQLAHEIINPQKLLWAINSSDYFKSPGLDGIFPALLKWGGGCLTLAQNK